MTQHPPRPGARSEDPLGALTRATLASSQRPGGPDCPDPGLIAAFYDGSIGSSERPAIEAHLSVCARCQSEIAAIARADTDGRAEAAAGAHRHHWWKWMAPVAAGALAYGLWLAVEPKSGTAPTSTVISAPVSQIAPETRTATLAAKTETSGDRSTRETTGTSPSAAPGPPRRRATKPKAEADAPELSKERAAYRDVRASAAKMDEGPLNTPPPPAPTREDTRAAAAAPAPPPSAALQPAAAPPRETSNKVAGLASAREEAIAFGAADAVSQTRAAQWRLDRDGLLSRSNDEGTAWTRVLTGSRVRLTAISAPGRSVCWAVGASGTIVRTVDGQRWDAIHSPTTADIRAVEAGDASTATITDADGRRYRTTDGGKTWQSL